MNYLILANLYMALFYAFYGILLKKETFFQYNRIYLTGTLLLSYLLPLIQLPWVQQLFSQSPMQQARASFDEVLVVTTSGPAAVNSGEAWSPVLVIYWAGVALMTLWLCIRGYLLARQLALPQARQSYSFLHFVRVDPAQAGGPVIWQHERAHVRYLHSLDVIFAELALLFSWFNPIAYLFRKSIKLQHEYQADAFVAASGQDPAGYAEILLSNAFQVPLHTLTNHFNQQTFIKNRIIMLFKVKSKRTALLKYVFAAPLFAGMVIFSSAKTPEINLADTHGNVMFPDGPIQQGDIKFSRGMGEHIRYTSEAVEAGKAGIIGLAFHKEKNGVKNIQTVGNFGYGMEAEVERVVKMPKVYENLADGKYYMNIRLGVGSNDSNGPVFAAPKTDLVPEQFAGYTKLEPIIVIGYRKPLPTVQVQKIQDTTKGKEVDFTQVEVKPEPPGGMAAFLQFVGENYKYPQAAKDNKVSGKITLQFVVNTDGSLDDITLLKDLGYGTGEEAKRVLGLSKNWKPGLQDGKPVRVMYTLPIALAADKP